MNTAAFRNAQYRHDNAEPDFSASYRDDSIWTIAEGYAADADAIDDAFCDGFKPSRELCSLMAKWGKSPGSIPADEIVRALSDAMWPKLMEFAARDFDEGRV